jgi:hypothetical protein
MAIPASGAISMSMLATEFSSSQTTNMSLFGLASKLSTPVTSNIFEAASFYGQSALTFQAFVAGDDAGNPFEDQESACSGELTNATFYHSGTGTHPVNGDRVFTAQNANSPADDGWYGIAVTRSQRDVYEVYNGDGSVRNKQTCE